MSILRTFIQCSFTSSVDNSSLDLLCESKNISFSPLELQFYLSWLLITKSSVIWIHGASHSSQIFHIFTQSSVHIHPNPLLFWTATCDLSKHIFQSFFRLERVHWLIKVTNFIKHLLIFNFLILSYFSLHIIIYLWIYVSIHPLPHTPSWRSA
jgi:hypothetical protein